MPDLAEELRSLVDGGAPPITLDELDLVEVREPYQPRARAWAVAGMVAAVIVGTLGVVAIFRADDPASGPGTAASDGEDCQASRPDADLEVFMRVDATPEQVAAARAALAGLENAIVVAELSKEDSYEHFRCLFANNPDLLNSITADEMFVSFLVRTASPDAVRSALAHSPGVDTIAPPPEPEPTSSDSPGLTESQICAMRGSSSATTKIFDHGTGGTVAMTMGEWCGLLASVELPRAVLDKAGLAASYTIHNGEIHVSYFNVEIRPDGSRSVAAVEVPRDEAEAKIAAAR